MGLTIGQKVKKIPIKTKEKGMDRVVKIGTVVDITKHTFTVEYEHGIRESFSRADIINPDGFVLKIKEGKEWVRLKVKTKKPSKGELEL